MFEGWTWPHESVHIWEALSPHLSCTHNQLKTKGYAKETSYGNTKLSICKSFKIKAPIRKMRNYRFPNRTSASKWPKVSGHP